MLNFERKIICLNENWKFTKQHYKTSQWEEVNLPHTWNNIDGQDGGNDYYRGSCLYMKKLFKSEIPESDEYYLEINGANSSGDVFWNDMHLAHHDGGYSCWRVQLTNWKEENTLIIQVDNSVNDSVYPQMADFTFYGGLYRDVNLICVNSTHFDLDYFGSSGIKITPHIHGNNATIEIETFITHFKENQQLRYILLDKNHQIIQTKLTSLTHLELTIEQVHLWHARKDPYLYCCVVEILDHEQVIDAVHCRFGCRTFSIDPDKGFILNGEEYPLHGVSRHQDRFQIGNALSKKHHLEDMELICEVGANTIRLAHYQHDSYFYDLCDEKGMVVWAEIPYISRHMPNGRENTISQMKELITQNYNHPSIVVWGLSNEISMKKADDPDLIENHHILNDLVHEMDPTRLTTLAVLSTCPIDSEYLHIPDVVAYNHYFGWYGGELDMYGPFFDHFHSVYPKTPIAISEYGCE
ncbi:MAG: glycoside hydrolase family 2 protein, partial [Traorella sp.]